LSDHIQLEVHRKNGLEDVVLSDNYVMLM